MENKIKHCIYCDSSKDLVDLLNKGLDPNYEGGWPIRLAARHGSYSVVKTLIQYGANPHLLGESGASTLQLAVYSAAHWDSDKWTFLLSFCDSSQLADGAAVAIIFNNIPALTQILQTERCNTNIPTTLTGKTVEDLAKGYKLHHLLNILPQSSQTVQLSRNSYLPTPIPSPTTRQSRSTSTRVLIPHQQQHRNLSPSVARFFHQAAEQSGLTPPRATVGLGSSPTTTRSP